MEKRGPKNPRPLFILNSPGIPEVKEILANNTTARRGN